MAGAVNAVLMSAKGGPPFRAEHIGSLLRPGRLIAARRRFAAGEMGHDDLAAIEAEEIAAAVKLQEAAGLAVVTDGEFRRASYHSYFYSRLGDITIDAAPAADAANGNGRGHQPVARIGSRVRVARADPRGRLPSPPRHRRRAARDAA
jgi:5-methyltetrahydropteroyltriglutamate--homocysteine methyltransferase